MSENEDMGYYLPESGTNLWSDAMVIPANAKNPDLAHEFINFASDYEGINAYVPRSGNPNDEVFEYNENTRKLIANLWSKVKIAASNAS